MYVFAGVRSLAAFRSPSRKLCIVFRVCCLRSPLRARASARFYCGGGGGGRVVCVCVCVCRIALRALCVSYVLSRIVLGASTILGVHKRYVQCGVPL